MGWRDRPYARHDYDESPPPGRGRVMAGGVPRPGRVVKYLLFINIAVFVVQAAFLPELLTKLFAVIPNRWYEPWRYVTFQFLHGGIGHIFFNMLALYFLGMILEAHWGGRRFLAFYLICGVVAGVVHVVLTPLLNQPMWVPLIGASGGVYAVLLACAVFFPQIRLFLYFLIPVPIRVVAAIFLGIALLNVLIGVRAAMEGGTIAGGISHPAHLGGAAAAAAYIWIWPLIRMRPRRGGLTGRGRWARKLQRQHREDEAVDRILDKIRRKGLRSLNRWEKRTLRKASQRQQREDDRLL